MFGTSGVRGVAGTDITPRLGLRIGAVAGESSEVVTVGQDTRRTGEALADAVTAGALQAGADVERLGVATTPTVARYARDTAVVVTASHNPPEYNGFKLFNADGTGYTERQRRHVEGEIDRPPVVDASEFGRAHEVEDAEQRHVDDVVTSVGEMDVEVVVDAAGGAASNSTPHALARTGCRVHTVNCRYDDEFARRLPEPVDRHLDDLKRAVRAYAADVGIAHDGDGDRAAAVTADGTYLQPDLLMAAFARHLDVDHVVTTVDASMAIEEVAEVSRTAVGDVNVARTAKQEGAGFGGEASNTWIFPEATYCPDGVLAAAYIAEMASVGLESYVEDLRGYVTERGNVDCRDGEEVVARAGASLRERFDDVSEVDGVRVAVEDGWFLVRPSGTEPKVRLTAESRDAERAGKLLEVACSAVEEAMG
ncbi:MAG: phosphoglucosamine mutase [Halobacteriota archaeon]